MDPRPTSAKAAREFVRRTLQDWSKDHLQDLVALLACELVTNGILHARTSMKLRLHQDAGRVRVELSDASVRVPLPTVYDEGAQTGRGLALVEALAVRWGVERRGDCGKVVWFEVQP